MKLFSRLLGIAFLVLLASSLSAHAQFDENGFKQALKVKRDAYLTEGTFSGGDGTTGNFKVSQIRVAANPAGYDRLVIEAQTESGRPPFFMIENDPSNKRIQVTLYGKAKLDFSSQMAIQQARKTKHISQLEFIPLLSEDRFTFLIKTQVPVKSEVFELNAPSRIIIDLKP